MKKRNKHRIGFTLVELLVVISVIAMLLSILMPSLSRVRFQAKSTVCKSNIRQLALANKGYSLENDGHFVLAAKEFLSDSTGGLYRWHGVRENNNQPFNPAKGPLAGYLGDGKVKECPEKTIFLKGQEWDQNFEQGCGGYGYNQIYLGSRIWDGGFSDIACENSTKDTEVKRPAETLMFADCAIAKKNAQGQAYVLEYSFLEPPFWLSGRKPMPSWGYSSPTIHFRHQQKTNAVFADGHIDSNKRLDFNLRNGYGVKSADFEIGWFGVLNNSVFDLE